MLKKCSSRVLPCRRGSSRLIGGLIALSLPRRLCSLRCLCERATNVGSLVYRRDGKTCLWRVEDSCWIPTSLTRVVVDSGAVRGQQAHRQGTNHGLAEEAAAPMASAGEQPLRRNNVWERERRRQIVEAGIVARGAEPSPGAAGACGES